MADHFAIMRLRVSIMGETFKYCAPIAGSLGFSVEDTAAAFAALNVTMLANPITLIIAAIGFADVPSFIPENYLKNAEMAMEDDYGMIDGIINNGPKEQPEVKAKAPDMAALFEEASRTVQEDKTSHDDGRKQSALARLHEPTPPRNDKAAPTKSAERDLL